MIIFMVKKKLDLNWPFQKGNEMDPAEAAGGVGGAEVVTPNELTAPNTAKPATRPFWNTSEHLSACHSTSQLVQGTNKSVKVLKRTGTDKVMRLNPPKGSFRRHLPFLRNGSPAVRS